MAFFAGHVLMLSIKDEACGIMVEGNGFPFVRSMATRTIRLSILCELPGMGIFMAGGAVGPEA